MKQNKGEEIMLTWTFICLIIMMLLGFPIYLSLIGASILYITLNPDLSMMLVIQKVITAPNSFPLLAIPFFILAGQIMNTGGITKRIFNFAECLVGHFRGGLAYVNILASMIFAGMSGSAIADAGGLGLIEIKAMRDANYDDDLTIGITAASSIIGPIIPPSVPFVIYGALANVSIGGLFVGGFIPGLLMGLLLSLKVFIISKKRNYPFSSDRASFKKVYNSFKGSCLAIFTPVIIIGGIWLGYFTPTEAAFIAILYALIVTTFIYKEFDIRKIPALLLETTKLVAPCIMIVGGAAIFAWIMGYERVSEVLINIILGFTSNKYIILFIINLILLIVGMFVDVIAAIMILLPILQPLATVIGIHPIHFGVIVVLNLMVGLLTPPVGDGLYILSLVTKRPFEKIVGYTLPWILPLFIVLLLITYIPDLVLFLPKLMGFM